VKLLLDTHVLLWCFIRPKKISARAAKLIRSGQHAVWFSACSVWEIEIKRATGKLTIPDDLLEVAAESRFTELPVTALHAQELRHLPNHHADPFDRLLVAQARVEGMTLVTVDEKILAYPVSTISAG
jgi:PIN domain nuclease of toxin-antitoxin system